MRFWNALFGHTVGTQPYFTERSDEEAERLLLETIQGSPTKALVFGNSIVHGMRMPWEQARRVIEKLKVEGRVDYEIPHNTWVTVPR